MAGAGFRRATYDVEFKQIPELLELDVTTYRVLEVHSGASLVRAVPFAAIETKRGSAPGALREHALDVAVPDPSSSIPTGRWRLPSIEDPSRNRVAAIAWPRGTQLRLG